MIKIHFFFSQKMSMFCFTFNIVTSKRLMNMTLKSFHFIFFSVCLLTVYVSCDTKGADIISKNDFIKIYSRLLIINEMKINKDHHDILIEELLRNNKITLSDLQNTINYFNENPEQWIEIINKVRDNLQQLKTEQQKKLPVQTKPPIQIKKPLLDKKSKIRRESKKRDLKKPSIK